MGNNRPHNFGEYPEIDAVYFTSLSEVYKDTVSARILMLRVSMNLSQRELAKYMAVTAPAITMIETGKRLPSFELLCKLADFFNVSIDYLVGRSDNPKTL